MAQLSALENMAASGSGAAMAVLFTNPLEVAKTRLQMQNELVREGRRPYKGSFDCLAQTWRREGLAGVQRGLPLAVLRDGTKCFFRLGLYDPLLRRLHAGPGQPPLHMQLLAGGLSGMVAAVLCNPLDLLKVRIQSAGGLSTSHHALEALTVPQVARKVFAEEGLAGLWTGWRVNVVRSISFTAVLMAINSRVKSGLDRVGLRDGVARDVCGAFAGSFVGIFFMNPVDVVRTRLYNQPADARLYAGMADAASKIARAEGPLAFWKGAAAHYLRVGPHTVLSFAFIGKLKRLLLESKTRSIAR